MGQPIFCMRNNHVPGCGEPPHLDNDDGNYHSYFENTHGDQWMFRFNRESKTGELRGGDLGWDQVFPVIDGVPPGLILGREEAEWLRACLKAATGV